MYLARHKPLVNYCRSQLKSRLNVAINVILLIPLDTNACVPLAIVNCLKEGIDRRGGIGFGHMSLVFIRLRRLHASGHFP